MNNSLILNAHKFFSLSLKLGIEACQIIRDSYMNKSVKQFMKGKNDPVTEADFKIQSMYMKGYQLHLPGLKVIGQQQTQYEGHIETDYGKLELPELPHKFPIQKQFELQKCCLWIDPLDNTRGFIEGQIEAVTTLIGMSYQSKAEFGIVGIPFKKHEGKVLYDPSLLLGSVSGGFAYEYFPNEQKWVKLQNDSPLREKVRVALSPTRQNVVETKIIEEIKGEKIMAGGAGYKMALVAKKQAEMMAYSLSFTQKWDTCAGQAVIKGMKGFCSTQWGEEILYNDDKPKQRNKDGVICSLNSQLHEKVLKLSKLFSVKGNF